MFHLIINAIRIKFLPKLAWKYMGLFHDPTSDYPMEVINLALDMINFRLYDFRKKKKEKKRNNFVKVYFQAKVIECLRLSYILRKHSDCIPDDFVDRDIPTVLYKRSKNIGSTIFNYKDTVEEVKTDEWKTNYNLLPGCDCKDSKFCDPHHGHIVTGDLRFIKNKKLRSLLRKGPGYRERQSVNWKRFMTDFKVSLDNCVNKWASSEEQDVSCLNEWKAKVLHDVQNAIKRLNTKRRYNQKRKTMILKSPKVMRELAELQKKYVFVPTDKAANNIAVVCKRFYIEKTMKELNIFSDDQKNQNSASTYRTSDEGIAAIIKSHIRYMKKNFESHS